MDLTTYILAKNYADSVAGGAAEGLKSVVVDTLPETGEPNTIYFVPNPDNGNHTEYMYVNDNYEVIGSTDIEIENYLAKDNTQAYTPTERFHPATKLYVDNAVATVDWDASEETQGYIHNRTHWVEDSTAIIYDKLFNTPVYFLEDTWENGYQWTQLAIYDKTIINEMIAANNITFTYYEMNDDNNIVRVEKNIPKTKLTVESGSGTEDIAYYGNPHGMSFFAPIDPEDNGLGYCIMLDPNIVIITTKMAREEAINGYALGGMVRIEHCDRVYHKLNNEFLNTTDDGELIATKDYVDNHSNSGTAGSADWNASEGEPGYIANRTHYEGVIDIVTNQLIYMSPQTGSGYDMVYCDYPNQLAGWAEWTCHTATDFEETFLTDYLPTITKVVITKGSGVVWEEEVNTLEIYDYETTLGNKVRYGGNIACLVAAGLENLSAIDESADTSEFGVIITENSIQIYRGWIYPNVSFLHGRVRLDADYTGLTVQKLDNKFLDIDENEASLASVKYVDKQVSSLSNELNNKITESAPNWNAEEGEMGHIQNRTHYAGSEVLTTLYITPEQNYYVRDNDLMINSKYWMAHEAHIDMDLTSVTKIRWTAGSGVAEDDNPWNTTPVYYNIQEITIANGEIIRYAGNALALVAGGYTEDVSGAELTGDYCFVFTDYGIKVYRAWSYNIEKLYGRLRIEDVTYTEDKKLDNRYLNTIDDGEFIATQKYVDEQIAKINEILATLTNTN